MSRDAELFAMLAAELAVAQRTRRPIAPIAERLGTKSVTRAYEVQRAGIALRLAASARRDRITGRKIGLTSAAVQQQLGVDQPDFGTLLASMEFPSGSAVPATLIQPRIEAEVAFGLARDLRSDDLTLPELERAIAWAAPALEIVDSRILDWRITIFDTVADNASAAAYVLGERRALRQLDLRLCGMVLEKNGEIASLGVGAACLGHPLNAALWLARKLVEQGTPLVEGDVVLSGALGPMVSVAPGDRVLATIQGLGPVSVSFSTAVL